MIDKINGSIDTFYRSEFEFHLNIFIPLNVILIGR